MRTMRIIPWWSTHEAPPKSCFTLVMEWWLDGKCTEDLRWQLDDQEFNGLVRSVLAATAKDKQSMPQFRKRPVEISAWQVDGSFPPPWLLKALNDGRIWVSGEYADKSAYLIIQTLEGEMRANFGDWIIRGVEGEIYPCKPDIFAKTYEEVKYETRN